MILLQRGFTLAELMIVVGIMGILIAIVLGAVSSSRNKAHDTNIKNDIRQLQVLAEGVYAQDSDYANWTGSVSDSSLVTTLQNDIIDHYGSGSGALIQESQVNDFCISHPLKTGGYYCVDADKEFETTTGPCSSHQCP